MIGYSASVLWARVCARQRHMDGPGGNTTTEQAEAARLQLLLAPKLGSYTDAPEDADFRHTVI